MSTAWTVVVAVGIATIAIKAAGPVLLSGRGLHPTAARLLGLLGPAVLAALVAAQTLGSGQRLVVDARAAGVGAAGVALLLRAPLLAVVVLAAAVTATVRAVWGG